MDSRTKIYLITLDTENGFVESTSLCDKSPEETRREETYFNIIKVIC